MLSYDEKVMKILNILIIDYWKWNESDVFKMVT